MNVLRSLLKWIVALVLIVAVSLFVMRAYRSLDGPPLHPWHTFVPAELKAEQLDRSDWNAYLAREQEIMASVRAEVSQKLAPDERAPINRYFEGSPVYPASFARD